MSSIDLSLNNNPIKLAVVNNLDGTSALQVSTSGASAPVVLTAGEMHLGEVGGKIQRSTVNIVTASGTTGYNANDVVGTASPYELTNVARVTGGTFYLMEMRIVTDKKSIVPRFRIHFFNANNPTISADNANWQDKFADKDKRIGYVDMPAMTTAADTTNSDMSRTVMDSDSRRPMKCATGSTSVWIAIETLDAFTPAAFENIYVIVLTDVN